MKFLKKINLEVLMLIMLIGFSLCAYFGLPFVPTALLVTTVGSIAYQAIDHFGKEQKADEQT